MPALGAFGLYWHVSSDDVPVFAVFGALFHSAWIVAISFTGQSILRMPATCHDSGRQYIATVVGLLFCFVWGLLLELLLVKEGCKGGLAVIPCI